MFGIQIDGKEEGGMMAVSSKGEIKESTFPIFGDPDEYKHLSQKEKEELTEKMKDSHKRALTQKGIPSGIGKEGV